MRDAILTGFQQKGSDATKVRQALLLERGGVLYARIALGAAFLSAVADRFGFWGKYGVWGNFANFEQYAAQVNSFMPAFIIPFLAWAATASEFSLGIALCLSLPHVTCGAVFMSTAIWGAALLAHYDGYAGLAGGCLIALTLPAYHFALFRRHSLRFPSLQVSLPTRLSPCGATVRSELVTTAS